MKLWVKFIYNKTILEYPQNIHNVSLRTFVECILNIIKAQVYQ